MNYRYKVFNIPLPIVFCGPDLLLSGIYCSTILVSGFLYAISYYYIVPSTSYLCPYSSYVLTQRLQFSHSVHYHYA